MNRIVFPKSNIIYGEEMLELGCGNREHWRMAEDYRLRQDIQDFGQNIVWDMEQGIPVPDDYCKQIYASNIFEHLHPEKIIFVMNECWRVLRKGGIVWVIVPDHLRDTAYIPSHLTRFTEATFRFFTGDLNRDYEAYQLHQGIAQPIKIWETVELITNERGDIHWKATPKGKI